MGKRPWSSGMRSVGLLTWKAPAAMKRMWSVRTGPYFVETVVPSTIGRRSRWTPSRETSGPWVLSRPAILSISSRNTMPADSARRTASRATWSWSTSRDSSSCCRISRASGTVTVRRLVRLPKRPGSMSLIATSISSAPWLPRIWKVGIARSGTSTSTVRASSCPARSCARSFSRVPRRSSRCALCASGVSPGIGLGGGSSRSRSRSSTRASAFSRTSACFSRRTRSTAAATRSRTIASTSRPT